MLLVAAGYGAGLRGLMDCWEWVGDTKLILKAQNETLSSTGWLCELLV